MNIDGDCKRQLGFFQSSSSYFAFVTVDNYCLMCVIAKPLACMEMEGILHFLLKNNEQTCTSKSGRNSIH